MKKLILCLVLLFVVAGASLFSFEANDLTKFPPFTENKEWIFNLGAGIGNLDWLARGRIWIPPVRMSFDRNTGIGEKGLPFFFGGVLGYQAWGWKAGYYWYNSERWMVHRVSAGFRAGYHFNWGVEKLDTYAVTTVGTRVSFNKDGLYWNNYLDWVYVGVNLGVRFYPAKNFGFWAEVGYTTVSFLDLGISFKF